MPAAAPTAEPPISQKRERVNVVELLDHDEEEDEPSSKKLAAQGSGEDPGWTCRFFLIFNFFVFCFLMSHAKLVHVYQFPAAAVLRAVRARSSRKVQVSRLGLRSKKKKVAFLMKKTTFFGFECRS